jgi:hypothetical protein
VRVGQYVSAVRAVEVPVLVCLRHSRDHLTEVGFVRLALKFITGNMTGTLWMWMLYRVAYPVD